MRVDMSKGEETVRVTVAGDEAWLSDVYAQFPQKQGTPPRLKGEVLLVREAAGSVKVTGKLDFAPLVACSRCDREVSWPLAMPIDVRFFPENVNAQPREKTLTRDELDAYYLDYGEVDLAQLVLDTVATAMPTSLVPEGPGGSCRVCGDDLRSSRVFGSDDAAEPAVVSPFAKLKDVKVKN